MLVLVWLGVAAVARSDRTTVTLDLGWRVHPAPPPPCTYSVDLPGHLQGTGWQAVQDSGSITTADECEAAACSAGTQAWSFCAGPMSACPQGPRGATPPFCIIGSTGQVFPKVKAQWRHKLAHYHRTSVTFCFQAGNWTSRVRPLNQGPPADSTEAQLGFDDDEWKVVDLPHDASIERK